MDIGLALLVVLACSLSAALLGFIGGMVRQEKRITQIRRSWQEEIVHASELDQSRQRLMKHVDAQRVELRKLKGTGEPYPSIKTMVPCCKNERRNMNGWCDNCGDPSL